MALLMYAGSLDESIWISELKSIDSSLDIRVYPDCGDIEEIDFILARQYPAGLWEKFPNVKAICSMGAGVNHILNDSTLDPSIPILKLVDKNLNQEMFEYLLAVIGYHAKDLHLYEKQQKHKRWNELPAKSFTQTTVGIVGMGSIGSFVAEQLTLLGFAVVGFSNSPKQIEGIVMSTLDTATESIMQSVDIWISILPLTPKTTNIFNASFFARIKRGSVFVNVGRGPQVVADDLIQALESGRLSSAYLDVFEHEPLSSESALWMQEGLHVTPHIASITNPASVAEQIVTNYHNTISGVVLNNMINRKIGY